MTTFNINWLVKKSPDWIVAQLIANDGAEFKDVSINRTNKKGEPFPNFDGIMPGANIDGELWTSPNGKNYLFAPKVASNGSFTPKKAPQSDISKSVEAAQKRTEASIGKTLDRKEESIRLMSAQRDAVLIVNTLIQQSAISLNVVKEEIIKWRNWFLNDETFNNPPPFN